MKEQVYRKLIELSNGKMTSTLLKKFSTAKLSRRFIRGYIKFYKINTNEVSKNIKEFPNLQQFFVRTLKEESRPIENLENGFTSPVDGKIESFGNISSDMLFTVKGKPYSLEDLLGNVQVAEKYRNGKFIVFYLSPADYHRLHSPMNGEVIQQYVLGQKSYPVNQLGLTYGKKPISHNYRMISELKYSEGHFSFIKVGAMFVNSIELTNNAKEWVKGEEVGFFSFGSTVVMLFEKDTVQFTERVVAGEAIRVGQAFATVV